MPKYEMVSVEQLKAEGCYPLPIDENMTLLENLRRDIALAGTIKMIKIRPPLFEELLLISKIICFDTKDNCPKIEDIPVKRDETINRPYEIIEN